jgi:hypothetical protein
VIALSKLITSSLRSGVRVVAEGAALVTSSSMSSSTTPAVASALAVALLTSSAPVLPPGASVALAAWVALVDLAEAAPDVPAGLPLDPAGAGRVTTIGVRVVTVGATVNRAES